MTEPAQRLLTGELVPITEHREKYGHIYIKKTGRPIDRLTAHQVKMSMRICQLDISKKGKIWRSTCPEHGRTALTYRFQQGDGVHIWCELCAWTTHFDEYHFHPTDDPTFNDGKNQDETLQDEITN